MTVATATVSARIRAAAELELRRRQSDASDKGSYQTDFDYRAIGWHERAWEDQSKVLLFTGSAGGGKSRLAMERIHDYCKRYPGSMWLMVRKTRESMRNSSVLMYNNLIGKRDKSVKHVASNHRFEYSNGSIVAYGGMKDEEQREQVRSIGQDGGLDGVWMEEATRFAHDDFQELVPRLRAKAGPYRQMMITTNPGGPKHWINQLLINKKTATVYYSSAKDNPFNPPEYVEWLNSLTGILHKRLVLGLWVQSEGVIYDNFDADKNITFDADFNPDWTVRWGVDDGYAEGRGPGTDSYHPRVILLAHQTPLGGLDIFAEYYKTQEADYIVSIDKVLELGYSKPELAYIDSSAAMFKANLWNKGITTHGATHAVIEGIRNVRRLIKDGNGQVLLRIHPRCTQLIEELQSYEYDETAQISGGGDRKPVKMNDHGPDALRYLAWTLRYGGSHDQ